MHVLGIPFEDKFFRRQFNGVQIRIGIYFIWKWSHFGLFSSKSHCKAERVRAKRYINMRENKMIKQVVSQSYQPHVRNPISYEQKSTKITLPGENGHVRDTEVRPRSTKSLLEILLCEVGFREQHEKCGLSSDNDNGHLFWLRISTLVLLLLFLVKEQTNEQTWVNSFRKKKW